MSAARDSAVRTGAKAASRAVARALGAGVERAVTSHHRRRLRNVGWEHAFDPAELGYARGGTFEPRAGNRLDVLIDGSSYLPLLAEEIAAAKSHVHLLGWCFSPELHLTREEEPVVLRNLLADVARRVDVRLLVWEGCALPDLPPDEARCPFLHEGLHTGDRDPGGTDSCVRLKHSHHEKIVVVDDRVAFVGGIDLTLDGGDPFDSPMHRSRGQLGWHDAAVRIEGPAVADVAEHFRLRWRGPGEDGCLRRSRRSRGESRAADRAHDPRARLRFAPQRRVLRLRVVLPRPPLGREAGLSREPVPVVTRDRLDPRATSCATLQQTTSGSWPCCRHAPTTAQTCRAARSPP